MTEPRVKSIYWVQAQVRACFAIGLTAVVARRGDPDAGAILVKHNRITEGCVVFVQARGEGGRAIWMAATGAAPVAEADADAYIARQLRVDPDIWVLEVEDPRGEFCLAGSVT